VAPSAARRIFLLLDEASKHALLSRLLQQAELLQELRNKLADAEREYVQNRTRESLWAYLAARRALADLECALKLERSG